MGRAFGAPEGAPQGQAAESNRGVSQKRVCKLKSVKSWKNSGGRNLDFRGNGERRSTEARMKRSPHLSIRRHTSSYAHSHFHSISAGFAPWAHSGVWPTGKLDSGASSGRFFGCGNRDSAYVDVSRRKDRLGDLSIRARVGGGSPLSRKSGISGPNIVYAAMQVMDLQGNPCRVQEPFPRHQA